MSVPVHQKQSSNVSISSLPLLQANVVNRRLRSDFKCGFALYVWSLKRQPHIFFVMCTLSLPMLVKKQASFCTFTMSPVFF